MDIPSPHTPSPSTPALRSVTPESEPAGGPTHLTIRPWWDPELARTGVDPRSTYAERFWLPVIGPSTLLLIRRFARGLDEHPSGFRVPVADTARALGLGTGNGRNSPLLRTVDRACTFGLARRPEVERVDLRTHLPRLDERRLRRLPDVLREAHDRWELQNVAGHGPSGPRAA